jgi:hypothetical protein
MPCKCPRCATELHRRDARWPHLVVLNLIFLLVFVPCVIALLVLAGLKAVAWVVGFLLVASMTYEVIAYRRGGLVATTQREKSAYRLGWLAWFVLMFAIAAIVQRMVH